jgi:hypothetical protein
LKKAAAAVPPQTASQYTSFIGAMDAATSFGGLESVPTAKARRRLQEELITGNSK